MTFDLQWSSLTSKGSWILPLLVSVVGIKWMAVCAVLGFRILSAIAINTNVLQVVCSQRSDNANYFEVCISAHAHIMMYSFGNLGPP